MKFAILSLFIFAYAFDLGLKPVRVTTFPGVLARRKAGHNETIPLSNFPEIYEYYVNAFIGTPAQPFRLIPSFSSPYLSVIESSCSFACPSHLFDASLSTTYQSTLSNSSALLGFDTVTLAAGLAVRNLTIATLESANNTLIMDTDGLLVSAMQGLMRNKDSHSSSLVWRLYEEKKIETPSVAIFLSKSPSTKSVLSFGKSHPQQYAIEAFRKLPAKGNEYWEIVSDLRIDNESALHTDTKTYLVPEFMAIGLPEHSRVSLQRNVCKDLSACETIGDFLKFQCELKKKLPDLVFTINKKDFRLPEEFYVQRNGDSCWLMIMESWDDGIILGSPFFHAYYVEFDFESRVINIAKSLNQKKPEVVVAQFNWWVVSTVLFAVVAVVLASAMLLRKKENDEQAQKLLGDLSVKV